MLPDPITLYKVQDSLTTASALASVGAFRLVDLAPGKSVRTCADFGSHGRKATLTISHSTTSENAPYGSNRTLIRLDVDFIDNTTGKTLTGSCYAVVVLPRTLDWNPGGSGATEDMWKTVAALLLAENPPATANRLETPSSQMLRMINGEP